MTDSSAPDDAAALPLDPAPSGAAERATATPPHFADGTARSLERGWIAASRFGGLVFFGILGALGSAFLLVAFALGKLGLPAFLGAGLVLAGVVGVALLLSVFWPKWEYGRAGYRILPDRIESWNGLVFRRAVSVPISRVQYTDVKQGPIQRHHGIATLAVHTAGTMSSDIEFPGLPPALANEIRDWLVSQTGSDAV
ncbi:MAG: PH domain-containing protein [Planctomycetota bacterium]|nr:PH domain-containing protein [Planctomycetota bacterium]